MVTATRRDLDPVADLRRRLGRRAHGSLRAIVKRWWSDQGLAAHPAAVGKRVGLALLSLAGSRISDRSSASANRSLAAAGLIVLEELLSDHLRANDLPAFADVLARGALSDAALVDAFAVKVLGTLLGRVRGRAEIARAISQWRTSDSIWQRRAACVAFTTLAPQGDAAMGGLTKLIFHMCSTVVWSTERLDQSAVGWLLRELSRAEPTRVEAFVRRHARFMSRECMREAIDRLPPDRQRDLLVAHKRATTLRRG